MGKNKNKANNKLTQKQLQTYQPKKNKFQQSELQAQYIQKQKQQKKQEKPPQKRDRSQNQKDAAIKQQPQQQKKVKTETENQQDTNKPTKVKTINIIELKDGQKQNIIQNLREFFTENLLIDVLEESDNENSGIDEKIDLNKKPKIDNEEEDEDDEEEENQEKLDENQKELQGYDQYNQQVLDKNIISYNQQNLEKHQQLLNFFFYSQNTDQFKQHYFEKQPMLIKRKDTEYYKELFHDVNMSNISEIIDKSGQFIQGQQILIKEYKNNTLQNINNNQKINTKIIEQNLKQSKIIELVQPKLYIPTISYSTSLLEQQFNSVVSSKITITQKQVQKGENQVYNQETFIIQTQGQFQLKLFKPQDQNQQLPRFQDEIDISKVQLSAPIADITINAGDFVYIPRGVIYQKSYDIEQENQVSITLEFNFHQNKSTADFLERFMPILQTQHSQKEFQVRKSLPFNMFQNLGQQASEGNQIEQENSEDEEENQEKESNSELKAVKQGYNKERRSIINLFKQSIINMVNNQELFEETIDNVADDLAIEFLQQRMPPLEIQLNQQIHPENILASESENWEDYEIRFVTKDIGRIVSQFEETEEGKEPELDEDGNPYEDIVLYHCGRNSADIKNMTIKQSQPIIFPMEAAGALEQLFACYPDFLAITDLQLEEEGDRLTVAQTLYDHNLILVRKMDKEF